LYQDNITGVPLISLKRFTILQILISQVLILSANSWPSRSLSKMHADAQIASYREYGLDSTFVSFKPSTPALQYKNPIIYREMLDTVDEITMESVTKELKNAEYFRYKSMALLISTRLTTSS
jgi:hypothetical protein